MNICEHRPTMKTIYLFLLTIFAFTLVSCSNKSDDPTVDTQTFKKLSTPVFESPLKIASDPSVIRIDADTLHLYYTAENLHIGLVISSDNGRSWQHPNGITDNDYAVLSGRPNNWDKVLETVDVIKVGSEYWMYYTGYRDGESDNAIVENYQIGLAISIDGGFSFVRHVSSVGAPLIPLDVNPAGRDRHAMTSPSVTKKDGKFYMSYTGWNTTNGFTGTGAGFWVVGATSNDGITWNKLPDPLFSADIISWTTTGINEADMILAPNGKWYYFFTAEEGIGVVTSDNFTGPFVSNHSGPLITPEHAWEQAEVVAPNILFEDGYLLSGQSVRIWYIGVETDAFYPAVIGYAEAAFPLI